MIKLLLIDLGLINIRLKDIKNDVDEALGTEFKKGKESSQYYNNLESKFKQITDTYFIWNTQLQECIGNTSENASKSLIEALEDTSEEIKNINLNLKKLRKLAETDIRTTVMKS